MLSSAEIFRYEAGNPASKELLAVIPFGGRYSMAMSPDQRGIYVNSVAGLFHIDVLQRTVVLLNNLNDGSLNATAGIAVVPVPCPPIPTVSLWGGIVMTLLVLTAGTLVLNRRRYNGRPIGVLVGGLLVKAFSSPFEGGG